jgi:hypothetical protein
VVTVWIKITHVEQALPRLKSLLVQALVVKMLRRELE